MIPFKTIPPSIPLAEQTPTVRSLLSIIEQQQTIIGQLQSQVEQLQLINEQQQESILQQQKRIGVLETEVARLKKLPKKPNIRPSTLPKDDDDDDEPGKGGNHATGKSGKPRKRKKKLAIHKSRIIKPDNLPEGSRLLGYENYTVQDLLIQPDNTRYRLARYLTPDGKRLTGVLPEGLQGKHFGATLEGYILYQHHHQRVTQPLILQQLTEWGVDISSGQISNILIEDREPFHTEKDALLSAGINNSSYLHVDDTGAAMMARTAIARILAMTHLPGSAAPDRKAASTFLNCCAGRCWITLSILQHSITYAHKSYLRHRWKRLRRAEPGSLVMKRSGKNIWRNSGSPPGGTCASRRKGHYSAHWMPVVSRRIWLSSVMTPGSSMCSPMHYAGFMQTVSSSVLCRSMTGMQKSWSGCAPRSGRSTLI